MFLNSLANHDSESARIRVGEWLASFTELTNTFSQVAEHTDLAGSNSTFIDIYPTQWIHPYSGFGGIFVRVWAIGSPSHLIYGIYLGSKVSKSQNEIRSGVSYAREKLGSVLSELERGTQDDFSYKAWTDRDISWLGSATSVRAVVRQLDLFITFKEVVWSQGQAEQVYNDITSLVHAVDTALPHLGTSRRFAEEIVRRFFLRDIRFLDEGEGLPSSSASSVSILPQVEINIDWSIAQSDSTTPCELKSLHQQFKQAVAALQSGKHVIFLGPPGTGKTELALCICSKLNIPYNLVTATSEWTTFDVIGGYFPDPGLESRTGASSLNFLPAIVPMSLEKGRWLIIDELNRADIDKAFGELFTLLSGKSIRLPYKKRQDDRLLDIFLGVGNQISDPNVYTISVPSSWRMIGTMNTFDKASLYRLSFAFMRRFAFIHVPIPSQDDYNSILEQQFSSSTKIIEKGDVFYQTCLSFLKSLFSPDPDTNFAEIGVLVGPAIAIDIIKYIENRCAYIAGLELPDEIEVLAKRLVLEGIEMYLYPQFEGKDQQHRGILQCIEDILSLTANDSKQTELLLANWTGFEIARDNK